jgi:hypothetical protein
MASFPQFSLLPTELQFYILSFCSPRILFQVMRVSSPLRLEASKLFWAHSEAYFLVSAQWLVDGGYPGSTYDDLSFLRHVQNIFVECGGVERSVCPNYDEVVVIQQDRIHTFWESLASMFPKVKRVMLDDFWEPRWWNLQTLPVPYGLHILAQHSPLHITTTALIVEEVGKNAAAYPGVPMAPTQQFQRSLYQPLASGVFAPAPSAWPWKIVLPPTKPFNGPVGKYMALGHRGDLIQLQQNGLWPLMVEALDRHHFHNGKNEPFSCPSPDCGAYFTQAGQWTIHAAEMHYNEWIIGDRFCLLPPGLKQEFEERARALKMQLEQIGQSCRSIRDHWYEQSTGKQEEMEREWMAQLENNRAWDTGTTPRASRLWNDFLQEMIEAADRRERDS